MAERLVCHDLLSGSLTLYRSEVVDRLACYLQACLHEWLWRHVHDVHESIEPHGGSVRQQ